MAFSCVTRNVFSILPLLIVLSISPLSSSYTLDQKVTKEMVNQLCAKPAFYSHFCVSWLNSDPKTFTLTLQGLIDMVYAKTETYGNNNLEMIRGLERTTADPKLKASYGSCVQQLEVSTRAITQAKGFASKKAYSDASNSAFTALNGISTCEAQLKGSNVSVKVAVGNVIMCNIDMNLSDFFFI
ncbi:hypothetical protein CARUB_v10015089mg [Capsella rubella]|uniref:Pectinesterase inhibitor domain-containing protein n=1 Tax=Capsella rubella TaxID=81985 RepID=R0G8A2_9BRAS|nr:hypothetical protein CARUB_v10015089mg [Capsella rubella]